MVGVNKDGFVAEHEHIFDIFTKIYDDLGSDVEVLSAQDLWSFYRSHYLKRNIKKYRENIQNDIYVLVEFFIQHHSNGHFIIDECPFLANGK